MPRPSRYRPEALPDYSHRFHAGNIGDVWKHCVLVEILARAASSGGRVAYLESHAGEGRSRLGPTGEWTEGIGRLWGEPDSAAAEPAGAVARYLRLSRTLGIGGDRPRIYPGSPEFAQHLLGPDESLVLYEADERTLAVLRSVVGDDPRVRLEHSDGLAALTGEIRSLAASHDQVVALVDPPYGRKSDWNVLPEVLAEAAHAAPRACLLLWYPVKSLTRPQAMRAGLAARGVRGSLAELITTPLAHQRNRLNGSGMILVNPPAGALEAIAAAAPTLGAQCETGRGEWSFRLVSWEATPATRAAFSDEG